MRTRLRHDLTAAIKARDRTTTRTLRSALSAIENAEASAAIHAPKVETGSEYIAGSTAGLGAAEVERRMLSDRDVRALMQTEVDERLLATAEYERCSRGDLASQLRAEADVLRQYLHDEGTASDGRQRFRCVDFALPRPHRRWAGRWSGTRTRRPRSARRTAV